MTICRFFFFAFCCYCFCYCWGFFCVYARLEEDREVWVFFQSNIFFSFSKFDTQRNVKHATFSVAFILCEGYIHCNCSRTWYVIQLGVLKSSCLLFSCALVVSVHRSVYTALAKLKVILSLCHRLLHKI